MTTYTDVYGRPAVTITFDDDGDARVTIRASRLDDCRRRLYYIAAETPESDEIPPDSIARMEMGLILEPYVLTNLERWYGWAVARMGDTVVETRVSDELVFAGVPDALGHHMRNEDEPTVIEVKTRSTAAFHRVAQQGNYTSQFAAVAQLATYRQALVEAGVIAPDVDAVIATLNKDTAQIHQEWFSADNLRLAIAEAELKAQFMLKRWEDGIPPADFSPDSWQCRNCVFRTTCGNVMLGDDSAPANVGPVSLEAAADAIREWEPRHLQEAENRIDKQFDMAVRSRLLTYLQSERLPRIQIRGEHYHWNVSVQQHKGYDWDPDALRYMLTPAQLQEAQVEVAGRPYVEIRRGRRV